MINSIRVFAPASVSNLACGFDIIGFALSSPGDEIILKKNNHSGKIQITKIQGDNNSLSLELEKNTAGYSIKKMFEKYNIQSGLDIEIIKKMKIGTGLGSSAASSSAAVCAVNQMFELNLSDNELVECAMQGESIASGSFHADNVAPSLLGGFILIRGYNPVDIIRLKTNLQIFCTIVSPNIEIKTIEARRILPTEIPLKIAIKQWGNVGGLVAGLLNGDENLIARSLVDEVVEPYRSKLIPYYFDVKNAALETGALGCNISGSGPSIFALSLSEGAAEKIRINMTDVYKKNNIDCYSFISQVNNSGSVRLD